MGRYSSKELQSELKRQVRQQYGQPVLTRALSDLDLENDVLEYAADSTNDDLELIDDVVGCYLDEMRRQLDRLARQPVNAPRGAKYIAPERGSLQNVAAYAAVLPLVLQARQAVFGHRQPLSYEGATKWLKQENESEPLEVIEVTFRFRVPSKDVSKLRRPAIDGDTRKMLDNFQNATIAADSPIKDYAHTESSYRRVFDEVSRESFRMSSAEGATLVEWAEFIADMCASFNDAAWLILTGLWNRLGLRGRYGAHPLNLDSMKATALDLRLNGRRAVPFVELVIGELETTPDEIKDFYAQVRKRYGYSSQGRAMSYRTEVLALIAVEIQETEGVAIGSNGFYERVLKRYLERAQMYGLEVDSSLDKEDVRKALKGVESAYSKMVSNRDAFEGYSPELFKKL